MWSSPAGSPKELVPSVQHLSVNVAKINHVIIQTCGLVGVKKRAEVWGFLRAVVSAQSVVSTVTPKGGARHNMERRPASTDFCAIVT